VQLNRLILAGNANQIFNRQIGATQDHGHFFLLVFEDLLVYFNLPNLLKFSKWVGYSSILA
jgi:hypothetical protein